MVTAAMTSRHATVGTGGRAASSTVATFVARLGLFQAVDPAAVAAVTKQLMPVYFARHQTIYTEGQSDDRLYFITSGKIKFGRRCAEGRRHLLAIMGPPEMFGELSIFDPGPHTSTATAVTDVHALSMHRDVLRAWVAHHPKIGDHLLRTLARRLRHTDHQLSDLIFTDAAGRMAKQLLRLAQQFGIQEDGAVRVNHDLTQEELAQLIGASRETVNKLLTEFTQRGWIRPESKSLLITDTEGLAHRKLLTPQTGTSHDVRSPIL